MMSLPRGKKNLQWSKSILVIGPLLTFLLLYWAIRYWHFTEFGFYEDDQHYVLRAINMSKTEFVQYIFNIGQLLRFYDAGHPLHPRLITLSTKLGWWIGKLDGLYLISFIIGSINISLFYLLLKRMHSVYLGIIGTLMYVLYSADTTQAYLTFAMGLQPSITFFLIAAHLYISEHRWIIFVFAGLSLFTYETTFPMFFALPMLTGKITKERFRELISHVLITGFILIIVILWRAAVGENRVGQLSITEAITTPLFHSLQGPIVSLGTYLLRPYQTLQSLEPGLIMFCGIIAVGIWLLIRIVIHNSISSDGSEARSRGQLCSANGLFKRGVRQFLETLDEQTNSLLWFAVTGLIVLILAYPFTFTVRAFAISGRDTRVHATGVVGAALLLGSIILFILLTIRNRRGETLVVLSISAWLSLIAGFGFIVQKDYSRAWELQRSFWKETMQLAPDLTEGTVILINPVGLEDTLYIGANTWNLPLVLEQLLVFPENWGIYETPRVYRLTPDWENYILGEEGLFHLNARTTVASRSYDRAVDPSKVILIRVQDEELIRVEDSITIEGVEINLKVPDKPWPTYKRGILYKFLIAP